VRGKKGILFETFAQCEGEISQIIEDKYENFSDLFKSPFSNEVGTSSIATIVYWNTLWEILRERSLHKKG